MVTVPTPTPTAEVAGAANINETIYNYNSSVNSLLAPAGTASMSGAINLVAATSGVNLLSVTPGASGTSLQIGPGGPASDTNANLEFTPKGTGLVQFGNTSSVLANGTVAATFSVTSAPTGASTSIQRWLTFLDSTGRQGYIPVF